MELTVNTNTKQPFTSTGLTTGLSSFGYTALVNGVSKTITPAPTWTELGGGMYTMNFIPDVAGEWYIFIQGSFQIKFTVVIKTMLSILDDLKDVSLGSWSWNKTTGLLTLYKASGVVMSTYNILDNADQASRERLS